jgi:hypothetical protein
MIEYSNFINEANMDNTFWNDPGNADPYHKHLLFLSDRVRKDHDEQGGKYPMFYHLYEDPNRWFGLSLIHNSPARIRKIISDYRKYRWTMIYPTVFRDTDSEGRNNLSHESLRNILDVPNQYYFYELVGGDRNANAAPDRNANMDILHSDDGKHWYFIITKNRNCQLVKTKTRQESGKWAEYQLQKLYGWEESLHDIKLKIKKNGVVINRANQWLRTIIEEDAEVFEVEDDPTTFIKYDLIIDGQHRIEVKKYKERERKLWRNGESLPLMLAEQCKISDRRTLHKIIEWYNENVSNDRRSWEYRKSLELLNLDDREIANRFSRGHVHDICDSIREYYNVSIEKLLEVFGRIPEDRWMAGVYGVYFAGDRTDRRNDFVIKIEDEGVRNMRFHWEIVPEWKGFDRIKLFMSINGNAWEYILTEGNNFVKAFQLKDFELYEEQRQDGRLINTPTGVYRYNAETKYWVRE